MTLKETRLNCRLSQAQCADILGVSIRTYQRYERNEDTIQPNKVKIINDVILKNALITEDKGVLSISEIKEICKEVFKDKEIEFCYLFGSYAKGYAKENSDVDLLVSTNLTGLSFLGLNEELRDALHKRVDLIRFSDLSEDMNFAKEIFKDGIKIYG